MKIILVNHNNNIEEHIIADKNINNLEFINNEDNYIELICNWNYNDFIIKCYSTLYGDESIKNKHTLPFGGISDKSEYINSNNIDLYGNIYILCTSKYNGDIIDFTIPEYGEFYFIMNEEEENIDNSSNEDDDDNSENKENISDNDKNYDSDINSEDELLNNELDDTKFNYTEDNITNNIKKKTINNTKYIQKKIGDIELDIDNNNY